MGLDISVYKVIELPVEKWVDETEFRILDDYPELIEKFGDKKVKKEIKFYDLETEFKKLGFDPKQKFLWLGESYGEDVIMEYGNTEHELFDCFEFLRNSRVHLDDAELFQQTDEFLRYRTEFLPILEKYGFRENFEFDKKSKHKRYYTFNHVYEFVEGLVKIEIKNPSTTLIEKECIVIEEVGYQRKGANKLFYSEDMWDSPCVTSLDVLKDHHEKYFSYPTPEIPDSWGSGVEFKMESDEMKNRFQENIIDKFIEDETFVIYH